GRFGAGNEPGRGRGGGGPLAAFPKAYAAIMPALYLPVIVMLLGLVFRGVTFEFRGIARRKGRWNFAFAAGSTVAAFAQGVILGGLIPGIHVGYRQFAGGRVPLAPPL